VPNIAISPDSIAFGSLFVGAVRTDSIRVSNTGTDVLHVTAITATPGAFHAPAPLDLAVGESRTLPVTFAPTAPGIYTGTIEFTSNAHNAPTLTAPLFGEGLVAPDIAATPESLAVSVFSGDVISRTLLIQNTGGSELTWQSAAVSVAELAQSPVFSGIAAAPGVPPAAAKPTSVAIPGVPPLDRMYTEPLRSAPAPAPVRGGGRATLVLPGEGLLAGEPAPAPEPSSAGPGAPATATAAAIAPMTLTSLEGVLGALDAGAGSLTSQIPLRYDFLDGESGTSIPDGGGDMFDSGNFLYGDFGPVAYTNGPIVPESAFGAGARYFTRKYPGLFVLAADLHGIGAFSVHGDLGADGSGSVDGSVFQTTLAGVTYRAFVKRVWGAGDPSVNHMIIVANDSASTHAFATSTNDDYHQVSGLATSPRLYYLLFASTGGNYVDNVAMQQIMTTFLNLVNRAPPWLAVDPDSGSTPPGGNTTLNVRFDATGLLGGDYRGAIEVVSNDPDENPFLVPVSMHVTGAPRIVASRDTIAFGTLFTGAARNDSVVVRNPGTDVLHVTGVSAAPGVFTVPTTPFDLAPAAERTLVVHYAPTVPGGSTGALTLLSNDPVRPSLDVVLTGNAVDAPIAGVAPPSLSFNLPEGGHQQLTLTLSNTGGSDLTFNVSATSGALATWTPAMPEAIQVSKALPSPREGPRPPRASAVVPALERPDVSGNHVLVIADGGTQDDVIPVLTGAGYVVTQVIDDSVYDGSNPPLSGFDLVVLLDGPGVTTNMPTGGQAAIRDFVLAGGGMISTEWLAYEVANGNYSVLQPLIPLTWVTYGEGLFTWSVATAHPVTAGVSPSFNVSTAADLGTANSGTVLVTSSSGNPMVIVKQAGLGHVVHFSCGGNFNGFHPFIVPDMQRLLVNAANWMTGAAVLATSPGSGTVPAHGSLELSVTADVGTLSQGTYDNTLVVSTNDPVHPVLLVPATITVTAAPNIVLSPDTLRFTSTVVGASQVDTVQVSNPGSQTLHVTSVAAVAPFSAPATGFDLAAGASRKIPLTFAPLAPGTFTGSLAVASDDPDRPTATVTLKGTGLAAGLSESAAAAALEPPVLTLALQGLVPNPPVRDLVVAFSLPNAEAASVELLDLAGRRLRQVEVGSAGPGRHTVSLGATAGLESGVYWVRLRHGGQSLVSKCVLMR
jgi:hypothetical protein